MSSRVAVIVTARNNGQFLREVFASIRAQHPAELIYCDDGSTDASVAIARALFPNVLALEHMGVAAARNRAYAALQSDAWRVPYVQFCDGDDLYSKGYLARAAAMLDADRGLGLAYPTIVKFEGAHYEPPWSQPFDFDKLAEDNYICSPSVYRREALGPAPWDPTVNYFWDWDLARRVTRAGWRAALMPGETLFYRRHPAQMTYHETLENRQRYHTDEYMRLPVTVFTPFAPGRPWALKLWRDNLKRSGLPLQRAQLIIADNTGDAGFPARVAQICAELRPESWSILSVPGQPAGGGESIQARTNNGAAGVTNFMGGLWRRALRLATGDLLWSLEDDVGVRDDCYARLVSALRPDVGMVGSPVVSRWRRPSEPMLYQLVSRDPYDLKMLRGGRVDYRGLRLKGVEEVGAVSTSCCIIRGSVFRGHVPTATPNSSDRWSGHEFSLMKRSLMLDRALLINWNAPADHMLDATTALTIEDWRREHACADYYQRPLSILRRNDARG